MIKIELKSSTSMPDLFMKLTSEAAAVAGFPRFHEILPLKDKPHPLLGSVRLNFTFRKAG